MKYYVFVFVALFMSMYIILFIYPSATSVIFFLKDSAPIKSNLFLSLLSSRLCDIKVIYYSY